MRFISATLQIKPTMRKPNSFTIYPVLAHETVFLVQSDKRIGRVDLVNREIYLSKGRSSGSYGPDLCAIRGAKFYDLTDDQISELTEARDKMAGKTRPDKTVLLVG